MQEKTFNTKERILYLAEKVEDSKQIFFKKINSSYGNFTGKSKDSEPNNKVIREILLNYPEINPFWLIMGRGDMLLATPHMQKKEHTSGKTLAFTGITDNKDTHVIKTPSAVNRPAIELKLRESKPNTVIVDAATSAGFGTFLDNPKKLEELPSTSLPCAPYGLNVAFQINGDSMNSTVRHLDFVAGNKIEDINNITDGHVYIIVDKEDGVLCKRLYRQGYDFSVVSDNPKYEPYSRSHHYILALFKAFCRFSFDFRPYNEYFQVAINKLKSDMEQVKKQLNMP